MKKLSIRDCDLKGKRVLLRADYNVPMDKEGNITELMRVEESIPTLNYILDQGASLVILTHLGRPKGKRVPEMSVRPVASALEKLLGREVKFADDVLADETVALCSELKPGEVSDPVKVGQDYYILKLDKIFDPKRDKAETPTQENIKKFLEERRMEEIAARHLQELRQAAVIEVRM